MKSYQLKFLLASYGTLCGLSIASPVVSQIVPDATLPVNSQVMQQGDTSLIQGGTQVGTNLFHSFQEFSIPTGGTAFFNNTGEIENILTRVTGGSISNINGAIKANGNANLFLLNPNGIVFNSNARLEIGGSFLGSTANSIIFADRSSFSTISSQTTPLLTISVPVGLQFGQNTAPIVVQNNGYNLSTAVPIFSPIMKRNSSTGLRVAPGNSLALVGGDLNLQGGILTAEQGRIELASIRQGQVDFNTDFAFNYSNVREFGNIRLSQQSLVDASGSGAIRGVGNRVSLEDGSLVFIQNQRTQTGGQIQINAAQSIKLSGTNTDGSIEGGVLTQAVGIGSGADIAITTQQLTIREGADVATQSYSPGNTGNLTVNADDFIEIIGFSPVNPSALSSISSIPFVAGDGGDVNISTGRLTLLTGASVTSPNFGSGQSGNVTVNATKSVEIIGQSLFFAPSSVSANAFNTGSAGSVTIDTPRLTIQNGGAVAASTVASGDAGSVTINASEFVEVSGRFPNSPTPSLLDSSAPILSEQLQQQLRLPKRPSGNSRNLIINTPRLRVADGASVGVSNDGTGNAGTLQINADTIIVDREGAIAAATASGEGGNMNLQVQNFLLLRRGGQITASASGTGNGGNINIDTPSLVAVSQENSDISANSVNARGGNVIINTQSLFGIQFRLTETPLSDVTATGANSQSNGIVQINNPDLDANSALVELPSIPIDYSQLITQGCLASQGNSFTYIGRGGLPPKPSDPLRVITPKTTDWVTLDTKKYEVNQQSQSFMTTSIKSINTQPTEIVEVTGWEISDRGEILLTDASHNVMTDHSFVPISCFNR